MLLNVGEKEIRSWAGKYQLEDFAIGRRPMAENGILVLTNQRLIWVQQQGNEYHLHLSLWLENLQGISHAGGGIMVGKHVAISEQGGIFKFYVGIGDKEFPLFRQLVTFQKSQRAAGLQSQREKEVVKVLAGGTPVVVENETLKDVPVQYCSNCGTKMAGTASFCSNCGTKLR